MELVVVPPFQDGQNNDIIFDEDSPKKGHKKGNSLQITTPNINSVETS